MDFVAIPTMRDNTTATYFIWPVLDLIMKTPL